MEKLEFNVYKNLADGLYIVELESTTSESGCNRFYKIEDVGKYCAEKRNTTQKETGMGVIVMIESSPKQIIAEGLTGISVWLQLSEAEIKELYQMYKKNLEPL